MAVVVMCSATACESPVAFYRPGEGGPNAPVAGLGAPAPYSSVRPDAPGRTPETDAGVPVAAARTDVYAATGAGMLAPVLRTVPHRLYVPNAKTRTVDVIDQRSLRVVGRIPAGRGAARVVPGWDLRRLWAGGAAFGGLVAISPRTARPSRPLKVPGADATYFDPAGRHALVLSATARRIGFHDPLTLRSRGSLRLPCGARHADFSADGTFLVASCATDGRLVRVDPVRRQVTGTMRLPAGARPGDLRLSPDGAAFYVTDAAKGGVWLIDALRLTRTGFVQTGPGARGLAVSRDARRLFVLGAGTVSAVDFETRRAVARWTLPGGGAEPGGVSADGSLLWLSSPATGIVYALSTRTGRLSHRVKVGGRPQAPCVYPQPGHHSLGGPGIYR